MHFCGGNDEYSKMYLLTSASSLTSLSIHHGKLLKLHAGLDRDGMYSTCTPPYMSTVCVADGL